MAVSESSRYAPPQVSDPLVECNSLTPEFPKEGEKCIITGTGFQAHKSSSGKKVTAVQAVKLFGDDGVQQDVPFRVLSDKTLEFTVSDSASNGIVEVHYKHGENRELSSIDLITGSSNRLLGDPGPGGLDMAIHSISPQEGAVGTVVSLHGVNFHPHSVSGQNASAPLSAFINGKVMAIVGSNGSTGTRVDVKIPPGAADGPIELTFFLSGGGLPSSETSIYSVQAFDVTGSTSNAPGKPNVTGFSPSSVRQAEKFYIQGDHFSNPTVSRVEITHVVGGQLVGTLVPATLVDDTRIRVTVPRTFPTGTAYGVKVYNSKGSGSKGGLTVTYFDPQIGVKNSKKPSIKSGIAVAAPLVLGWTVAPVSLKVVTALGASFFAGAAAGRELHKWIERADDVTMSDDMASHKVEKLEFGTDATWITGDISAPGIPTLGTKVEVKAMWGIFIKSLVLTIAATKAISFQDHMSGNANIRFTMNRPSWGGGNDEIGSSGSVYCSAHLGTLGQAVFTGTGYMTAELKYGATNVAPPIQCTMAQCAGLGIKFDPVGQIIWGASKGEKVANLVGSEYRFTCEVVEVGWRIWKNGPINYYSGAMEKTGATSVRKVQFSPGGAKYMKCHRTANNP